MKFLKPIASLCVLALAAGFTSCSDDDDDTPGGGGNETTDELAAPVADFVNKTVVPTYKGLADATIELVEICEDMEAAYGNTANVAVYIEQAGEKWKEARKYWELSEAFLFGAASNYSIDPHIDTWPLDYDALKALLKNESIMSQMSDEYVVSNLGDGLLGFHALEYIFFENGGPRHSSTISKEELIYTAAVARDLRNHCILLEAAWSPAGVTAQKQAFLEDADMAPADNFGEYMLNAGKAGSIYKNYNAAAQEIVQGCIDIADEVANTKIYQAYSGGDPDYIESPHSKNSQTDFIDNIISIRNAYCGSNSGDASVSDYIKKTNPDLDAKVRAAIEASIEAIGAAKAPFVDNISDISWGTARDVTNKLVPLLEDVINEL